MCTGSQWLTHTQAVADLTVCRCGVHALHRYGVSRDEVTAWDEDKMHYVYTVPTMLHEMMKITHQKLFLPAILSQFGLLVPTQKQFAIFATFRDTSRTGESCSTHRELIAPNISQHPEIVDPARLISWQRSRKAENESAVLQR